MDIIEIMKGRRSIRAYQRRILENNDEKYAEKLISQLDIKDGVRVIYLKKELDCTFITDCLQFLVCEVPKEYNIYHLITAGSVMQELVIKLTERGISTCFVGGFRRKEVSSSISGFDEKKRHIAIVVALGYKSSYLPFMVRWVMKRTRPLVSDLFYDQRFGMPLDLSMCSEDIRTVLDVVRSSPCSSGKQSMRMVKSKDEYHFYKHGFRAFDSYSSLGIGITMKNFETACISLGMLGKFVKEDPEIKLPEHTQYLATWKMTKKKSVAILIFTEDTMTERSIDKYCPAEISFEYKIMGNYNGDLTKDNNLNVLLSQIEKCVATLSTDVGAVSISCMSLGAVCDSKIIYDTINGIRSDLLCTVPASATLNAFKLLGIRRISLVTPYPLLGTNKVSDFFEKNEIIVSKKAYFGESTGKGFSSIRPDSILQKSLELFQLDEEVDAIYLSCTAFNALDIVEEIEKRTGVFAISSNQVQMWDLLRLVGYGKRVEKCGKLLRKHF